jgi:DNA-binding CsgD family transcriptional regulator
VSVSLLSFHEPSALQSLLSGNDAIQLLELIHASISCENEDDFNGLFPKIRDLFPFDFAISILGNLKDSGYVASGGVEIGFPEEFFREYGSMDYLHKDLLVKESLASRRLQYWPYDWAKLGQKKEIISLCLDFKMSEGYIHGAGSTVPTRNESIFCFSGSSLEHDARNAVILERIIPHLHMALCHTINHGGSQVGKIILSCREKEVLNWLKQGKSSWEMSVILGISERTINYHIYNIMQKLDAVNRPQAVAAAVRLSLIDLD